MWGRVITDEEKERECVREELDKRLREMSVAERERYLISIGHLCEHGYRHQTEDDGHDYEWDE